MALADNLVAYWKLEEPSGSRADATGRGNDLAPTNTPGDAAGKIGRALSLLSASNQFVSRASAADLQGGNSDFTLTAWVNATTLAALAGVMNKWTVAGNLREYQLVYNLGANRFRFSVSALGDTTVVSVDANNLGAPATGTWYFIVAWHDAAADTINIQVNDGVVDSQAHASGVFASTSDFRIGLAAIGSPWNGLIDEAAKWNRVLTAGERTQLYNGGAGLAYPYVSPLFFRRNVADRHRRGA